MIKQHPRVKQRANFCGTNTMTGRNIVNAMKIKNTPVARSSPKYMRDFPEGILLVADCKLPGMSLTPFETLISINKDYVTEEKKNIIYLPATSNN